MSNDIYGTDLAQTSNQDWQTTATADVATVSGPANLVQALQRRTSTRVGALFYAPSYGNGIFDLLSQPITDDWIVDATTAGEECILGDPRVASAQVTVTPDPVKRTVAMYYSWTDLNGNTGQFTQEVPTSV